jgi:hypothetical protein
MTTAIPASPPITSGARCLYAAHLVAGLGALAFASFAVGESEGRLLLPAALSALVAWLLRARLGASGLLAACAAEDDAPADQPFSYDAVDRAEFDALATRCAELENLRGTPRFDPWESLQLRRKLSALREHT